MSKCVFCNKKLISPVGLICPDCAVKNENNDIQIPFERISNLAPEFVKADNGKLEWSLVPFEELESVVKIFQFGAKKYSKDNWKKCDDWKRYEDAAMRHLVAYMKGEHIDSESGESHMAHLICNALFLMWHDNQTAEQSKEDMELKEEYLRLKKD